MNPEDKLERMAADREKARIIMRDARRQLQVLNGIAVFIELAWCLATLRMSILKSNAREKWSQINEELDKLEHSARRRSEEVALAEELLMQVSEPKVKP